MTQLGKDSINMIPKTQVMVGKMDKLDFIKIKYFAFQKLALQTCKDRTHIGRIYLQIT